MNITLTRLTGRRAWFVPDVAVTGDFSAASVNLLVHEFDNPGGRVSAYRFAIGGEVQELRYDSLADNRGNVLPATINQPVVIPIPRNAVPVAVVGRPSSSAVRLARTQSSAESGLVDLWIIETGYGIAG